MELVTGIEPATCGLRYRCTTFVLHKHYQCSYIIAQNRHIVNVFLENFLCCFKAALYKLCADNIRPRTAKGSPYALKYKFRTEISGERNSPLLRCNT